MENGYNDINISFFCIIILYYYPFSSLSFIIHVDQ